MTGASRDRAATGRWLAASASAKGEALGGPRASRKERLGVVFEHTANAMFILDDDRAYVDCNPAAERLLECSRDQIIGSCADEFIAVEGRDRIPEAWVQFLRVGYCAGSVKRLTAKSRCVACDYSATANFIPGLHLSISTEAKESPLPPCKTEVPVKRLSHREREVLSRIALGKQGPQIATELCISADTVRTHVQHILLKLGAQTRPHAILIGLQRGELSEDDL